MSDRQTAIVTLAGGALIVFGLALAYLPAAFIAAGVGLTALGLEERFRP